MMSVMLGAAAANGTLSQYREQSTTKLRQNKDPLPAACYLRWCWPALRTHVGVHGWLLEWLMLPLLRSENRFHFSRGRSSKLSIEL